MSSAQLGKEQAGRTSPYDIEYISDLWHSEALVGQTKTEVIATDEFVAWWNALPEREHDAVRDAVDLLEEFGVNLPFPHSSALGGARHAFRELRRKSGKHQLRIVYIFDEVRQAVLLIGGDKLGARKEIFYPALIRRATSVWKQYLEEQEGQP